MNDRFLVYFNLIYRLVIVVLELRLAHLTCIIRGSRSRRLFVNKLRRSISSVVDAVPRKRRQELYSSSV